MVLSKRERNIGIATASVLGLLGAYQFVIDPLLQSQADLDTQIITTRAQLETKQQLITRGRHDSRLWATEKNALKKDESEAQLQFVRSVGEWAQAAGLSLPSVQPDRPEKEKDFFRLTVRATGNGTMTQIGNFLWRVQSAESPVRISDLTIKSRKGDATDDLQLILSLSTIYLAPAPDQSGAQNPTASARWEQSQ